MIYLQLSLLALEVEVVFYTFHLPTMKTLSAHCYIIKVLHTFNTVAKHHIFCNLSTVSLVLLLRAGGLPARQIRVLNLKIEANYQIYAPAEGGGGEYLLCSFVYRHSL